MSASSNPPASIHSCQQSFAISETPLFVRSSPQNYWFRIGEENKKKNNILSHIQKFNSWKLPIFQVSIKMPPAAGIDALLAIRLYFILLTKSLDILLHLIIPFIIRKFLVPPPIVIVIFPLVILHISSYIGQSIQRIILILILEDEFTLTDLILHFWLELFLCLFHEFFLLLDSGVIFLAVPLRLVCGSWSVFVLGFGVAHFFVLVGMRWGFLNV